MNQQESTQIGQRIRVLRLFRQVSARDLGDYINISESQMEVLEGGSFISERRLARIAEKLDVSVDYLLTGEGAPWHRHNGLTAYTEAFEAEERRRQSDAKLGRDTKMRGDVSRDTGKHYLERSSMWDDSDDKLFLVIAFMSLFAFIALLTLLILGVLP